jgi:hypothetical protein
VEAIESCKMSISTQPRQSGGEVAARSCCRWSFLAIWTTRWMMNKTRCIYDLFVFLYPLNIITFHVYKMCQSHSSTRWLKCSSLLSFVLRDSRNEKSHKFDELREVCAVCRTTWTSCSMTSLCQCCCRHASKATSLQRPIWAESITLIKSTLS